MVLGVITQVTKPVCADEYAGNWVSKYNTECDAVNKKVGQVCSVGEASWALVHLIQCPWY